MRLDKFLKVSRIIKRRTLAKEVCDQGRVQINGHKAKAGSQVAIGDQLDIDFGSRLMVFRVEKLMPNANKANAAEMYELLEEKQTI